MSRKCPLLSAKNERQMRERRNRDETETRAKTKKEQRKNNEADLRKLDILSSSFLAVIIGLCK